MPRISFRQLVSQLESLGLKPGDVVHVQSDLWRVGIPEGAATRKDVCEFYFRAFQEVMGNSGTLSVSTAFEDYGHFGVPFDRQQSPSRTDPFSEYVRLLPGAVRSTHPIVSVTAIGTEADDLCGGPHFSGFGWCSPWAELYRRNAKILTLGLDSNLGGTTFFHFVEAINSVPYQYNKIFDVPVYDDGRLIRGPFTMSVRYLDFGVENSPVRIKRSMVENGLAQQRLVGNSESWCSSASDIVSFLSAQLQEDPWVMLVREPKFRVGSLPADGASRVDV